MKKRVLALWIGIVIFGCNLSVRSYGYQEPAVVRVGYFDYGGFLEQNTDGTYIGYGYEYLKEISSYLGWNYEFVYGSWEQCLDRLANGEIDLLCTAQYSEDRAKVYDYAQYSSGVEYAVLLVNQDNNNVFYNDYASFNGLRVGFMKESYQNGLFERYAKEHGFTYQPKYYNTAAQLQEALNSREIDAMLTGSLQKIMGQKAVARFSPEPFYFITTKGNTNLLNGLNTALEAIQTSDVNFNVKLYEHFYGQASVSQLAFTKEEASYIQEHPTLRVAYSNDWKPLAFTDLATEKFSGACAQVLNLLQNRAGFHFEFIAVPTVKEARELLANGDVELICDIPERYEIPGILQTKPYLEAQVTLAKPTHLAFEELRRIAVPKNCPPLKWFAKTIYPDQEIVTYPDTYACLQAVQGGKVDAVFENIYILNQYSKDRRYTDIEIMLSAEETLPLCIGMRENEDPALRSLFNKLISQLTVDETTKILINSTTEGPSIRLSEWLRRYTAPLVLVILIIIAFNIMRSRRRMERYAFVDSLTGGANETKFLLSVEKIRQEHGLHGYSIVSLDINKFKFVNSMLGFEIGNQVLKAVSHLLSSEKKVGEFACREANDRFFMLLKNIEGEDLEQRLQSLLDKLVNVPHDLGRRFQYTISCGVYTCQQNDYDIHQAVGWANLAREKAKEHTQNCIVYYDDSMRQTAIREQEITNRMEIALLSGEFTVYYQPKIRLSDEQLVGAEALARWVTPDGFAFRPDEFIPVFERNGFVTKLDAYIFELVCRQLRAWMDDDIEVCPVSVNLSRVHLNHPDFYLKYLEVMQKYHISPEYIELEITESILCNDKEQVASLIKELKQAGIRVSIDDFGSGYSSLNMMKDLPFDYLKLDKEFFNIASDSKRGQEVIRSVIDMAYRLRMTVVAEGVETREQVDFLKKNRCQIVQGYYYSKPLPYEAFENKLHNKSLNA